MPNMPSTPNSPSARAYAHVRDLIANGKLRPGSRLVTRTLAEETGMSLNPVREALGRLASEGVIDHVPGAGAFVRKLGRREIEEIFGMREALESYAAERAAQLITEDELLELDTICASWHKLASKLRTTPDTGQPEDFVKHWVDNAEQFHTLLVDAARNALLSKAVETFRLQQAVFVLHRRLPPIEMRAAAQTWLSHSRLVRALRRGDGERAAWIVREQMRSGRRHTLARLREEEESS